MHFSKELMISNNCLLLLTACLLLDMSKAFDSIENQILLHKMQNVCTLTSALKILDGLTATSQNNVYQVVWSHSSLSDPLPAECGVPQRSILSRRPII